MNLKTHFLKSINISTNLFDKEDVVNSVYCTISVLSRDDIYKGQLFLLVANVSV
jgi:hypothetical protein